ncbi:hypothetical protein L1049_022580 [Liquidambar formosana]|uniref:Phosphoenolpyruvate carboxylase n=1 Tax=Liquidambar formosana TaxID=63359 RepID=A0AAP0WNY4_LIQFO
MVLSMLVTVMVGKNRRSPEKIEIAGIGVKREGIGRSWRGRGKARAYLIIILYTGSLLPISLDQNQKGDFANENSATTESDIEETLKRLVVQLKKSPEEVFDALKNQTVDLVFTAHPTQSVRRSLLQKHGRIRNCLAQLYARDITPDDKQELDEALRREIQAALRTDEIRRTPPTPQDEMKAGMSYLHETIWKEIPRVTPEVTRDVCLLGRMMAANLYYSQIEDVMFELSMWCCSDELHVCANELHRS